MKDRYDRMLGTKDRDKHRVGDLIGCFIPCQAIASVGTRSIHMSERGHGASAAPQSAEAKRRQIANHRAKKSDLVQELPEVSPMRAIGVLCLSCDRLFPVVPTGRTFIQGAVLVEWHQTRERGKKNKCQLL